MVLGITLSLPSVQTKIAQYFVKSINKDFGINIAIDEVSASIFGGVKLKKVLILDHHKDTLIYSDIIKTNILEGKKILDGDLIFSDIRLDGLYFNLKTYKNEKESNIDKFIEAFETGEKPSGKHFLLTSTNAKIINGRFVLIDENRVISKDVDFTKLNASISDFKLYGPDVNTTINRMSFQDHRGIFVKKLSSIFSYTKKQIKLENLDLTTKESHIIGDIALNYDRDKKDFSNFTDKVVFDVSLEPSSIASNDIRFFYKEIGQNQKFYVNATLKGTLNNLKINNLKLFDSKNSQIIGTLKLENLFPKKEQKFFMDAKFNKLSTSYNNLISLLPNVLEKKLPIHLKKLGNFSLKGTTQISQATINAKFKMISALGYTESDLKIINMDVPEKVAYKGNVVLNDFEIGTLLDVKELKKISLNLAVDGKGFSEKYLNTAINGVVTEVDFNNYTYNNIDIDGNFKNKLYGGKIVVNDPNLKMNFDGFVDLSKKEDFYDFQIKVENSNFYNLKLTQDLISKFKGDVIAQVSGNSIDNFSGNVYVKKASYQNAKGVYDFDDMSINSSFDSNKIRTITVNSPDIIEGEIVGKFQFNQLEHLISNSLSSLYTNYKPTKVKSGQFLKFDFAVYSKIIEAFYPDISIGSNTFIKGNIDSDNQAFKLNFKSPKIIASETTFDNIRIKIDNKNPLYNAYIELDSIKTKHYKVRDFSLINVTKKDTLYFRTEFKGGSKGEDYFNLNLYHTINVANNNVLGISKSEIKLKDYLWYLNDKNTSNNQIVFDKSFKNFNFDNIILSHEDQEISLVGNIKGSSYKDLKLGFKNVNLNKITPSNPKFIFNGNINGEVNFKQDIAIYQPTASLKIDHLNVNNTALGNLNLDIEGDQNFEKFTINSVLENENLESFSANGNFKVLNKETVLDLNLKFEKFNLALLSPIGGDVISNIRGTVSGSSTIEGNITKPIINGRLYTENAGLTIPYLNVDFQLSDKSIIDLADEKFLFRNNTLTDTKFGTKGILNGKIEHNNFGDWKLDLDINSKRLLMLDTKDHDDAAYYGTAFINGNATIKGPVNRLLIKVNAKSEKGTAIKIPINDAESVSENNFIHFLTAKEKYNLKNGIIENPRKYSGLELEFDFDITPDAEVEVILDRNSGHGMKGKGNGILLFKINTQGKFNMWGDFQAYEGTYNFRYGGLLDKKFTLKKGGSISWEGDPMKAQLNLEAVYKTKANPAVLLENSSFNQKVDVDVIIGVRGDLTSPEPDFKIEFPTVSNVLKSEIQYKLNDKDVRQTQALSLLSTGGFLSPEGVSQSDLSRSLFETASNLLGGIFKTNNDKFDVNINIISADNRPGKEADGRFETSFSSKVNERITINGKVGVPFGGVNESAIVGDVEVQYRVNEDGTLNLRLFNRENEINYIGEGIGYTQGIGVSYEVDFDTFKELVNKIFKNHKLDREKRASELEQDSILLPDTTNLPIPKKNNDKQQKSIIEGIIPEND
ncbi:translocation/assembly module TamB domain-containing protein [Flavobacterium sp.]|uniref:translocation/assembly module TamB domain-containing protein n=1 Tax=Flavobacterium sp. TaxID=239 RepID=UPI00286D496C|nr:translocation/assembly module TamB domain-containing protein [Flavobacterium sp.]